MKEIIIEIDEETGKIQIETNGFKGNECIEASKFIKKALGKTLVEKKKPEYFIKTHKNTKVRY